MSKTVILVGATGDLGGRIVRELKAENATVRCLVRPETSSAKRQSLMQFASEVVDVNFADINSISKACAGGGVVVSAVAGLRDVIVELQARVLKGSVEAGIPRFI